MSTAMNVLSSEDIQQSELSQYLVENGAEVDKFRENKSVLRKGESIVWILREDQLLKEYEEEELEKVTMSLNSTPKTLIVLELNSDVGSASLALDFLYKLGSKWDIVVDDLYDHIYSYSEIKKLFVSGESFY